MIAAEYHSAIGDTEKLRAYADMMLREGFVLLPNFLTPHFLSEVEQFAMRTRASGVASSKSDDTTPMMHLARSQEFMNLFDTVYRIRCERTGEAYVPLDRGKQRVGLPYKDATHGEPTRPTEFHYDGAYINATIGIIEPPPGQGALHLFPNFRTKFGHPLLARLMSRVLRHVRAAREMYGYTSVPSQRNTLCLFFGDRSFHGVEPITSGKRLILTINNHW